MPPFILTFELVKKESAPLYRPLFRDLMRHGAHKYQLSCWLVNVANTAAEVHDYYQRFLLENDRLMVSELTHNHKHERYHKDTDSWIEANPPFR
ncbi:hypothetical protein HGP14_23410 [Rhizobium sp. P32RR-XVIII]|uniref:hypothetical protein n=1 Tax=Rhizobium sp. P32RR-XVIII TaxID=2726738 RepID=UPI0014571E4D|nr:hypothetical protein [Rhizobium sp. P32RR-XVIII]NLS06274.1 hypothetical protein [Rhizobium sp. P32RR-XVIII]